jgi:cytochrome c556
MKKVVVLMILGMFIVAALAFAAEELRPSQKAMQARLGWMTDIKENLGTKNFEAVKKASSEMAAQTKVIGDGLPNPLAKELTLAISDLSLDILMAAAKKDGETVKAKLGEIKGKCDECHAKIRDKK